MRGIVDEIFPGGVAVGKNQRRTLLRIVPHLAELGHGQGSKVYQNLTVVDIAKDLFKPWQIEVDPRLHPEPLKRDYCTQINESGLAFQSRILAEEGIHFHIEHTKDKSTVVLVNDPRGYSPVAGKEQIAYRDAAGAITVDHIRGIRRERRVRPNSVVLRDYNFLRPTRQMQAIEIGDNSSAPGSLGAREFYEYPGSYNDPDEPAVGVGPRAGRDALGLGARAATARGAALAGPDLLGHQHVAAHAGRLSLRDQRPPRQGVQSQVRHHRAHDWRRRRRRDEPRARQSHPVGGGGHPRGFVAVPAEVPVRPRVPPKPKAHLRTARVVGPKVDEPHVDEFGRIRIQFTWDTLGKHDEKSSIWVRMATTRAVLYRGLSVPGNKGKNEISCEDKAGKEEIFVHAQKDLNEKVLHNHSATVGANQSYSVGANQSFSVGANQSISVGANRTVSVKGDENISITNSRHENVDDGESVTVKGGRSHTVATKDDSLSVAAGNRSVTVAKMHKLHAKSVVEEAETTVDINAGSSITIHHGGDAAFALSAGLATLKTDAKIVLSNPSGTITLADGKVTIDAKDGVLFGTTGAKISLKNDGTVSIQGDTSVQFVSGGSSLKLEPATAVLNASATNVTASGVMEISGAMVKIN